MGKNIYSIIVPTKNEQATIGDVLEQVKVMSDDPDQGGGGGQQIGGIVSS